MKAMKFRVRDAAHSVQIQNHLFELGYRWGSSPSLAEPKHTEMPFLYANADGTIANGSSERYFEGDECVEHEIQVSVSLKKVSKITIPEVNGEFSRSQIEALARAAGLIV